MPPEQATGKIDELDQRADIYSLGAMLYEILTRPRPIEGKNVQQVLMNVSRGKIISPELRTPQRQISKELSAIVMKAMSKDPRHRYQEVAALTMDIHRYLEGRSVSAKADGALMSMMKLVKRNRAVTAVSAAALLVLLAFSVLFVSRLKRERDTAQAAVSQRLAEELANSANMATQVVRASDGGFFREAAIRAAAISAPASPWGPYSRGYLAWREGKLDDAVAEFATALQREPEHVESTNALAAVKAALGDVSDAAIVVATLDTVTQWRSAVDAGNTLYAAQDYAKALLAYEKASQLQANAPDASDNSRKEVARKIGDATAWITCANFAVAIAKLPVRQRVEQINRKLREVGGGEFEATIEDGAIVGGRVRNARRVQPFRGLNVRWLRFYGGGLSDLEPLRGTALRGLFLQGLQIQDLEALRGMPLTRLNISDTRVRGLDALASMPLETLEAHGSGIRDLAPLAGCPLRKLVLHHQNQIKDLTPLASMPLEYLDINIIGITSLSPLRGLALTYLDASYNPIRDLAPLAGMPLKTLRLSETEVSDLSPLRGAPLKELHLMSAPISDLSRLADMPLHALEISHGPVADISPLAGVPLRWINLSYSNVADISALQDAPLGGIAMRHSAVSDLSVLRGKALGSIDFSGTLVSDLSPLANMPLTAVAVAGARVRDFSALASLKNVDVGKCPWVPYLLGSRPPRDVFLKRCKGDVRHLYDGMKLEADGKLELAAVAWQAHIDGRHDLAKNYARSRLKALSVQP